MSLFAAVALAPRDPILGLSEQFNADARADKVNLGVGVYYDANGKLPVLQCVVAAEQAMAQTPAARGYLPIDGIAAYDKAVQGMVFGDASPLLAAGRVATVQALGGTGALRVAADFLFRLDTKTKVLISDPSWENHRALFTQAGFNVEAYPYYDAATRGVNAAGMLSALRAAQPGTVVVLHACCHNPTGADLSPTQWAEVVKVVRANRLVPILDMAYQGFGDGIEADGDAVRQFAATEGHLFVATSFSKSFSLYGERVGALSVVCASTEEAQRVMSQLKVLIRTNYSTPPTHGAAIVARVLTTPALREQWERELTGMRERIKAMRGALVKHLQSAGLTQPLDYITQQRGMFSYSGMTAAQMQRLRAEHGVYGVDSGRICVAALNEHNLPGVAKAVASVLSNAAETPR
jgi:aromatic-amino-acid transaminase